MTQCKHLIEAGGLTKFYSPQNPGLTHVLSVGRSQHGGQGEKCLILMKDASPAPFCIHPEDPSRCPMLSGQSPSA